MKTLALILLFFSSPAIAGDCAATIGTPELDMILQCGLPNSKVTAFGGITYVYDNVVIVVAQLPQWEGPVIVSVTQK